MAEHIKLNEEGFANNGSKLNIENGLNIQGLILNEDEAPNTRATAQNAHIRIPETTYDSNRKNRQDPQRDTQRDTRDRHANKRGDSERDRDRDRKRSSRVEAPIRKTERRATVEEPHQDSFEDLDDDDRKMMEELANPEKKKQEDPVDLFKNNDGDDDDYPPDNHSHKDSPRDSGSRDTHNRDRRSDRDRGSDRDRDRDRDRRHSSSPKYNFDDDKKWGYREPDITPEEELKRKQEILEGFDKISRKGIRIHRVFDINSDLHEMEAEYNRLIKQREIENSIKFQRKMLMAFVTGVEFLNNRYNPFDLDLDGWSEVVMSDVDNYDDIFEELYEKYHTKVNMAPELRLMFTLGGSAVMFHLTNTMFKSALPGMNPDMAKGMQKMAMGAMRSGLGGGQSGQSGGNNGGGFAGLFGGGGGNNAQPGPVPRNMPVPPRRPQQPQPQSKLFGEDPNVRRSSRSGPQSGRTTAARSSPKRREMRGPKNNDLDDILNDLNLPDNDGVGTDIEALLNSDDSEETKHISLKNKDRDGIKLNGRRSD